MNLLSKPCPEKPYLNTESTPSVRPEAAENAGPERLFPIFLTCNKHKNKHKKLLFFFLLQ